MILKGCVAVQEAITDEGNIPKVENLQKKTKKNKEAAGVLRTMD